MNSLDSGFNANAGVIVNLSALIEEFDRVIVSRKAKFDGRIFLPEIKKPREFLSNVSDLLRITKWTQGSR